MEVPHFLIAALGAFAAGAVNALAGGGTLITFPLLTAIGIPPLAANITNTLVLIPGYFGGIIGQRADLLGQKKRLWLLLPAAIGGLLGGWLLFRTGEHLFEKLIPFLVLIATLLLALSEPIRAWTNRTAATKLNKPGLWKIILPVFLAGIYGGYFGGVMSVIVLAILALTLDDSLTRLNALKQTIAFAANIAAAIFFIFTGKVVWSIALVMAGAALLGGLAGGRFAGKVNAVVLRWIVVGVGLVVSILFFIRTY